MRKKVNIRLFPPRARKQKRAGVFLSLASFFAIDKRSLPDQITPSGIKIASNRIFSPTSEKRKIFFALGFIFGT